MSRRSVTAARCARSGSLQDEYLRFLAENLPATFAIGAATEYRRRRGSQDDTDTSDADEARDD